MERSGIRRSEKSLRAGKRFCILLAFILTFAGCNPYQFVMGGPHIVTCYILTSLAGVNHDENLATLRDTAALDLNYFGATQYQITMGARLDRGEGFRILLRPVVERKDIRDSGIIVTATTSGVTLEDSGRVFLSRPDITIARGHIIHVTLLSENNYYQVVFDCDTVIRGWTKRKESDDVVVESLQASKVDVIHPDWAAPPEGGNDE